MEKNTILKIISILYYQPLIIHPSARMMCNHAALHPRSKCHRCLKEGDEKRQKKVTSALKECQSYKTVQCASKVTTDMNAHL